MKTRPRFKIFATLVLSVFLTGNALSAEQKTAAEIMETLKKKADGVKSHQADLKMKFQMMGNEIVAQGKCMFKKPKKVRIETVMDMGQMKMKQISISDGETLWNHQPLMKMAIKIDLGKVMAATKNEAPGQQDGNISRPFQGFDRKSIAYIGTEKLGEATVHVFEGSPDGGPVKELPFAPAKIKTWVGDDGLLRKMSMLNDKDAEMMSQTYTDIKAGVELDDKLFEFAPPEGTQVMDMTEVTINMLKQMETKKKEGKKDKDPE